MTNNTDNGRPYIVCHMMSSVDGRIDCDMTENLGDTDAYYEALDELGCDANLSGRVTMQMHTALPGTFKADDTTPIGREAWHKAAHRASITTALRRKAYRGLPAAATASTSDAQ